MSTVERGRRQRYDNISIGNAGGAERLISGDTVSKVEMHGGGFRTSTSNAEAWHTNGTVGSSVTDSADLPERPVAGSVALSGENVKVGG